MLKLLVPILGLALLLAVTVLSDRPLPRADFTFINKNDVTTMDIQRMSWMQDLRVARLTHEGLVRNDVFSWDYAITPAAAERWEVSPDRRVYTFTLRASAKWSNGEPVRASDFVYSWRRAMLPETGCDYLGQFHLIRGGREFTDWRQKRTEQFAADQSLSDRSAGAKALWDETVARFDETVGLKALDDRSLRVELERPTPYFLELCAFPVFFPVHGPTVDRFEGINPQTGLIEFSGAWTKPPACVGNGPFNLTLWRFKRDMRFEKSATYWNAQGVRSSTIAIPSVEDPNAAAMAFRTGSVDWVTDVVARYVPEMVAQKREFYDEHRSEYEALVAQGLDPIEVDRRLPPDPRKNIHVFPAFGTYFHSFNCLERLADGRRNPFADPRVRRAFSMTVDKRVIADQVRRVGEPTSSTLIPPGTLAGYRSPRGLPSISDSTQPAARQAIVDQARDLLAQAGFADPAQFPTVEILFNSDGGHDLIAQSMARDWREHLGVEVRLVQKEIKVVRDDLKNQRFMIARGSWYGDYGDPTTFLDISRSTDGNNDRKYNNPEYDSLLERASNEPDGERRLDLLSRAEELLLNDAPLLPLFTYAQIYTFDASKFTGLSSHPRSDQNLYRVERVDTGRATPLMLPPRPPESRKPRKRRSATCSR